MPTTQPAPDRMTVLARIDTLSSTLHDIAASASDQYTVSRIASNVVRLSYPDCPDELLRLAMTYACAVRYSHELTAACHRVYGSGDIARAAVNAAQVAQRASVAAEFAFESAMQEHYAPKS